MKETIILVVTPDMSKEDIIAGVAEALQQHQLVPGIIGRIRKPLREIIEDRPLQELAIIEEIHKELGCPTNRDTFALGIVSAFLNGRIDRKVMSLLSNQSPKHPDLVKRGLSWIPALANDLLANVRKRNPRYHG